MIKINPSQVIREEFQVVIYGKHPELKNGSQIEILLEYVCSLSSSSSVNRYSAMLIPPEGPENVEDYPNDPQVQQLLASVETARGDLKQTEEQLILRIKQVQAECRHPDGFEAIRWHDPEYASRLYERPEGLDVFLGSRCPACKKFEPRKKGPPWTVCYNCGGEMKFDGHGRSGEDRYSVHKCQKCGHEHCTS